MGLVIAATIAVIMTAFRIRGAEALRHHRGSSNGIWQLGATSSTTCHCLNWQDTYNAKLVQCGQGFEFASLMHPNYFPTPEAQLNASSSMMGMEANPTTIIGSELCKSFYERFDGYECIRTTMDHVKTEWHGRSWCYVAPECPAAYNVPNAHVKAKLCMEGQDALLGSVAPGELLDIGERLAIPSPNYLLKMAYPMEKSWSWNDRYYHAAELKSIKDTQKPFILNEQADEHSTNLIIVQGKRVWAFPGSYKGFRCAEGCESEQGGPTAFAASATRIIIPKGNILCYEGKPDYMNQILGRLQSSPMAPGWKYSTTMDDSCLNWGYKHNMPDTCFDNVTVYFDDVAEHVEKHNSHSLEFMITHLMESGQNMEEIIKGMGEVCDK